MEISTDGGTTYNNILQQFVGPMSAGTPGGPWTPLNLNLSNYIGLSNLRIRFNFQGAYDGSFYSNWAIDGVGIQSTAPSITYAWTPTATLTPGSGLVRTVTATPTVTTT